MSYGLLSVILSEKVLNEKNIFITIFFKDVEASSPAALAGLIAHNDFIVGADQVLQDVSYLVFLCFVYING